MLTKERSVAICSRDYWFKVVGFRQQNWALIDETPGHAGCLVHFLGDTSGVFDRLAFPTVTEAKQALGRNGFARLAEEPTAQGCLTAPPAPFEEGEHPNGRIYSSGKCWR